LLVVLLLRGMDKSHHIKEADNYLDSLFKSSQGVNGLDANSNRIRCCASFGIAFYVHLWTGIHYFIPYSNVRHG
jgi:hypothetical protein